MARSIFLATTNANDLEAPEVITQCIGALAVAAVVVVGLLVMVQAIKLEQALSVIGRVLGAVVLTLVAVCIIWNVFQSVVMPFLSSVILTLRWITTVLGLLLLLGLVTRVVARSMNRDRKSSMRGDS